MAFGYYQKSNIETETGISPKCHTAVETAFGMSQQCNFRDSIKLDTAFDKLIQSG